MMAYYNAKTPQQPQEPRPDAPSDPGGAHSFLGGLFEGVWRGGKKSYEQWLSEKRRKRRGLDPKRDTSSNWLQRVMNRK